jgi:RND family efflux transporter MFP subunit
VDSSKQDGHSRWFWRFLALGVLAAGVSGFVALQIFKPRPAVRPPAKQLPLVRVAPVEFRNGALPVTGHGLVKPRAEIALAAEISGKVSYVSPEFVTGGAFSNGDVLIRIDPEPFSAALAQMRADRQSALAALKLAEQLLARTEQLIAKGFLSRQTLDERIAVRDQAKAALARAEALENSRRIDLERTTIRAPFGGKVLSEKIDLGETVQPGKEFARIFADDVVEIPVSLTDRDVALISDPWRGNASAGNEKVPATVTVEHGSARYAWPGRVDRIEAAVDSATRTFNVVVRVVDPATRGKPMSAGAAEAPPLLVGMYATVEIAGRDHGRYAVVPRRALRDGNVLWLLAAGDTVSIRPVRVLREANETAAVLADGVPDGARVIVSDLKVITQGMPVRVVAEPRAAPAPAERPAS